MLSKPFRSLSLSSCGCDLRSRPFTALCFLLRMTRNSAANRSSTNVMLPMIIPAMAPDERWLEWLEGSEVSVEVGTCPADAIEDAVVLVMVDGYGVG